MCFMCFQQSADCVQKNHLTSCINFQCDDTVNSWYIYIYIFIKYLYYIDKMAINLWSHGINEALNRDAILNPGVPLRAAPAKTHQSLHSMLGLNGGFPDRMELVYCNFMKMLLISLFYVYVKVQRIYLKCRWQSGSVLLVACDFNTQWDFHWVPSPWLF